MSARMQKADDEQKSYPKLSDIYPRDRFPHLFCSTQCDTETRREIEYQILLKKYKQLLQDYKAKENELHIAKQDFIQVLLKTSNL